MVREPEFYVGADSPHAHRSEVATEDRSWSAKNVDIAAKIAEIAGFDAWVGLQLELEAGFGLRGKEARHLKPHGAIVTSDAANPRDAAAFPECRTFLHISAGSKGGRPRDIPIQTQAQQELLDRVMKPVPPGSYVGRPASPAFRTRRASTTSSASSASRRPSSASCRMACATSTPTTTSSGRRGPITGAWWDGAPSRQQAGQEARVQGARPQP